MCKEGVYGQDSSIVAELTSYQVFQHQFSQIFACLLNSTSLVAPLIVQSLIRHEHNHI